MHEREKFEEALLPRRKHARELAQVADDEADRVKRALGHGGVPADAVRRHARHAGPHGLDGEAVGVRPGLGQLGGVDGELHDGLARDGVRRLGARPRENEATLDGRARNVQPKRPFSALQSGNSASGVKRKAGFSCVSR